MSDNRPTSILDKTLLPYLSLFSFKHYLSDGRGVCFIDQDSDVVSGRGDAGHLVYRPCEVDGQLDRELPIIAIEHLETYDPRNEVICVVKDEERFHTERIDSNAAGFVTPIVAYRDFIAYQGKGRLIGSEVVLLKDRIDGISDGQYIFIKRDGAFMNLCKAGIDDQGDVCRTDNMVKLHIDFEECFVGIGVFVSGRLQ